MLTRMEFKFSEEKCKKYGVTLNACYKTIEKLMAEYGIHQYGLGVYVAPIKKAFTPFSFLACDLPESDWFDSNEDRDYNNPDYDCLLVKGIKR